MVDFCLHTSLILVLIRCSEQCRRKKVKCDGVTPQCGNCASLAQQCTYNISSKKVRIGDYLLFMVTTTNYARYTERTS